MSPGSPQVKPAGFKEIALWLLGQRRRFRVQGDSMLPLLKSGDTVLAKRTKTFSAGDIVVCRHPIQSDLTLIKKVTAIQGDRLAVEGLNPSESSDSRHFGSIDKKNIIGHINSLF